MVAIPGEESGEKRKCAGEQVVEVERRGFHPIPPALSRCHEVRGDMENWKEIGQQVLLNGQSQ